MKSNLFLILLFLLFIRTNAQTPNWAWAKNGGGADYDWGQCIAIDANGNTVVAGGFYSASINLGGIILTNPNTGKYCYYVAKYASSGNVIWARNAISSVYNEANDIVVDKLGFIYVTGHFGGVANGTSYITFGNITLANHYCCAQAFFIVKYTSSGTVVWAKSLGDGVYASWGGVYPPQPYYQPPFSNIAVNTNGDLFITGIFDRPTMTFGSTVLINVTVQNSYPHSDIFIAKYDSSGHFIWATSIGGHKLDYVSDIAINNSNIYLTGYFSSDTLNIGSTTLLNPNQSSTWDNYQVFAAKYDTSGNEVWANQGKGSITGIEQNMGRSIVVDTIGNCYITGEFESPSIIFANDTLINAGQAGLSEIFVTKYNAAGNEMWAKSFKGHSGFDDGLCIARDANENIYVGGDYYSDSLLVGGTTLVGNGNGIFIAKMGSSGNVIWAKSPGGYTQKHLIGLAVNDIGDSFITGEILGNTSFDSTLLTNYGQSDMFIAKLFGCSAHFSLSSDTILYNYIAVNETEGVAPLTYQWNWGDGTTSVGVTPSHVYSTLGNYTICLTISDAAGCVSTYCNPSNNDTVSTINVVPCTLFTTISTNACNSYLSPSGNYIWTNSGTYNDTVLNAGGCNRIITINLTVENSTTSSQTVVQCNPYLSPSGNYIWVTSGIYSDTIQNVRGCDSLITTNLSVNNTFSSLTISSCINYFSPSGNYVWTSTGIYRDTIANSLGCDSVITINLTINNVDATLTQNNITLTANALGAFYQWLDCDSGFIPITAATNQIFIATVNGNYSVRVTQNSCTDTSSCYHLINVGLAENNAVNNFEIVPNPVLNICTISAFEFINATLLISDVTGRELSQQPFNKKATIDISQLTNGIYVAEVRDNDGRSVTGKLVKE